MHAPPLPNVNTVITDMVDSNMHLPQNSISTFEIKWIDHISYGKVFHNDIGVISVYSTAFIDWIISQSCSGYFQICQLAGVFGIGKCQSTKQMQDSNNKPNSLLLKLFGDCFIHPPKGSFYLFVMYTLSFFSNVDKAIPIG